MVAVALVGVVVGPAARGLVATSRIFSFSSVDCVSVTDCFVVGSAVTYDGGPQPSTPFIARWNGTKWSIMRSANVSGRNMNALSDISCTAPDFCMAVGTAASTSNPSAEQPLVERWDGTSWKLLPSPVTLRQVSCTKKKFCMAVALPNVARWDGVKWTIVPTARVAAGQVFRVVSCLTGEACFAAGDYSNKNGYTNQVAERWNGTRWLVTPSKGSGYGYFSMSGLACANTEACMGAGAWTDSTYANEAFAQHWNGNTWSENRPASPSPALFAQLTGIACPAPTTCIAGGYYVYGPGPSGYPYPFVTRWNGTKWAVAPTPKMYGALNGISCAGTTGCLAVGYSQQLQGGPDNPYLGKPSTLALRWDRKTWRRVPTPNP